VVACAAVFRFFARSLGPCVAAGTFCALISSSRPAHAQAAPAADTGAQPPPPAEEEKLPAYHHSIFSWENTVTAATLGIGDPPQSSDPTYTMGLVAKTRYYFIDDTPKGEHLRLGLDAGLYREMTNSDTTTRRGELDFSDTELALMYARRFQGAADTDGTLAQVGPRLTFPSSKISYDSGRYFAAGALIGVANVTPWFRGKLEHFSSTTLLTVGYKRWFSRATVPTNESLERVRLVPDGRTLPSDALSGSSLIRDQIEFGGRLRLELGENILWTTDAALAPAWKYDVQKHVPVCGVVLTGCADVKVSEDDSRYLVRTSFDTEISLRLAKGFSLDFGYGNAANQLGQDGRRRNFFYSPEAVFHASISFFPHELASGQKQLAKSRFAPSVL
jgi:hypothetical protein